MPRKITSGIVGGQILGSLSTANNTFSSRETDSNIVLSPNGAGDVVSNGNLIVNNNKSLLISDGDSNTIAVKAPADITSNYTLTLPVDDGDNGQAIITNGSGVLSWKTVSVGITESASDGRPWFPVFLSPDQKADGEAATSYISTGRFEFVPNTGTLTVTALVETSSIALKENISPIENGLDSLLKLTGVTYDRKDGSSTNEAGLIAEEVNEILPNVVSKDSDGNPYGINYTKLSAYLIEAVKTLAEQVSELKNTK